MDYEQALQEALTAINSQQTQQQMAANIEAGNAAYGQLKDQAAVSRDLERQRLAQRMADLGMGGQQQPLTIQNNSMMAGQRDIGDISRQNRYYAGTQNAMINQADANAAAQAAGATAAMNAAEDASMLDEKMQEFDRLYRLYMAKKITKNQFKLKTGIDVRGWAVRKNDDIPKRFNRFIIEAQRAENDNSWDVQPETRFSTYNQFFRDPWTPGYPRPYRY